MKNHAAASLLQSSKDSNTLLARLLEDQRRVFCDNDRLTQAANEEIERSKALLQHCQLNIACFGSARTKPEERHYQDAFEITKALSNQGFNIITGGGPGIMEAGSHGAFEGASKSIGLEIKLPHEQHANPYLDIALKFEYFFTRKITFAMSSLGFLVMPGGFGTLDEISEIITLIQTQKMLQKPIVFYGKDFWSPFLNWIETHLLKEGMIGQQDLLLYSILDTPQETVDYFIRHIGSLMDDITHC